MRRGRRVFFVDAYYDLDCVIEGKTTLVVASRFKAKKIIRYIRPRCLKFHGSRIQAAWQRDLFSTDWAVNRRVRPPELHSAHPDP
jgi:hypothetical protein